jgi:hypothetical protein
LDHIFFTVCGFCKKYTKMATKIAFSRFYFLSSLRLVVPKRATERPSAKAIAPKMKSDKKKVSKLVDVPDELTIAVPIDPPRKKKPAVSKISKPIFSMRFIVNLPR